jgi:hypothetical protein
MSLDPGQLLKYVVRPSLQALGLPGGVLAEKLVLGTACQESRLQYLHQLGKGPALSLWQIEPVTAMDTLRRAPAAALDRLDAMCPGVLPVQGKGTLLGSTVERLHGDLYLGAAMCRLVYYMKPFRGWELPSYVGDRIRVLPEDWCAGVWKRWYNSPKGAGTEGDFLIAWEKFKLDTFWKGES